MKYLLLTTAVSLVLAAAAPAQAQAQYPNGYYGQAQGRQGALSPQDQQQFDKYYAKWVEATRKNDRDDIADNARKMQEIMARYNIPANAPFDQIASNGSGYPGANGAYPAYGAQSRLSPDDQREFDKLYSKWLDAQRKNDQDDVADNGRKMEQIMARYNIPSNVPFAAIATNGAPAGAAPYGAYGANAPYGAYGQPQRLSAKDQKDFDKAYRDWENARRKKDMDDVDKNERKMKEIMARYNIPANVAFDQIVSGGPYH